MGCSINSGHVALVQGLAVIFGVVPILLLADAIFDDYKFASYTEAATIVKNKNNDTFNIKEVDWIQKEEEYYRGSLDWILMISLIMITITHIALVLLIMHEISNRRKLKRAEEHQRWRSNNNNNNNSNRNSIEASDNKKPQSRKNSIEETLDKTVVDRNRMNSDPNSNLEQRSQNIDLLSMNAGEEEPQPKPGSSFDSNKFEDAKNKVEFNNVDEILPVPENNNNMNDADERNDLYQRRPFKCAAIVVGIFTLLLVSGIILEIHLIKQLDLFYNNPDYSLNLNSSSNVNNNNGNNWTYPFPSICAIGRRNELIQVEFRRGPINLGEFPPKGVCNNYVLKLTATGFSVILAAFSIALTFMYWLCDKKLKKNQTLTGNQIYGANVTQNYQTGTENGIRRGHKPKEKSYRSKFSQNNSNNNNISTRPVILE